MTQKFRAWDRTNRRMMYYTFSDMINAMSASHTNDGYVTPAMKNIIHLMKYDITGITQQRFVGVQDIDGHGIYEGDILRKEEGSKDDIVDGYYGSVGVVVYDESSAMFTVDVDYTGDEWFCICDDVRVVGNIYENPTFDGI